MARPRGVVLDDSHRDRVANGTATLAEIAAEVGVQRQSAWASFKRRGWATTTQIEEPDAPVAATGNSAKANEHAKGKPAGRRQRPGRQNTPASAEARCTSPAEALSAISDQAHVLGPAASTLPTPSEATWEEVTESARQEVGNIG